jgi:hypothetical protein
MSADSGKPKEEKQSFSLSDELSSLKQDIAESSAEGPKEDVGADMMELKRRMNKSETELKAMTDAMKGTLLDLRTLMQDVDNPFNLLRNMGVDKLVSGAVEQVEDEMNKAKREEAKKRMAEEPKEPDKIVMASGPAPMMMGGPAPQVAPAPQPAAMPMAQPQMPTPPMSIPAPQMAPRQEVAPMMAHGMMPSTIQALPMEVTQIKERMGRNETVLKELTVTLSTLIDDLKEIVANTSKKEEEDEDVVYDIPRGRGKKRMPPLIEDFEEEDNGSGVYYEAFVSLIGEYLVLRFGQGQAQQILMEGLYKGWASPKVVRDVIDAVRSKPRKMDEPEPTLDFGTSYFSNVRVEDKILITTLLKNLDKPMSPQEEPTQLFLLLSLVSKTREGEPNRA